MFIFLIGVACSAFSQVITMQDQVDEAARALDQMDGKVKLAKHEETMFYSIVDDLLRLAPEDPNANQVAVYFKLRELQAAQPELISANASLDMAATNAAPGQSAAPTNLPPVQMFQATNAAPADASIPVAK